MSDLRADARSISGLLGNGIEQLSKLLQVEIRLARAELADKATQAGVGVGLVFGGLLMMVPALVLLLIALAIFLTQTGLSPVWAHVLSGAIGVGASAILIVVGLGRLKPSNLTPDGTIQQVQKDVAAAREMVR